MIYHSKKTDRIFIESLSIRGKHGVSDAERQHEQEFVLDIAIEFDTREAAKSDLLADTVDYNHFRDSAHKIVGGQSFHLIEKVADVVAQKILADRRIREVSVTIRKTQMFPDCTPGITVRRSRG